MHDGRELLADDHASFEPVPGSIVWLRFRPWLVTVLVRKGADLVVAVEPRGEAL